MKNEIIELAKQAGFERLGHDEHDYVCYPDDIVAFATLVASAERDRMCEQFNLSKELAHEKAKSNEAN